MKAYINYPQPHATIHFDAGCIQFRKQHKSGQRTVCLNPNSSGKEIRAFGSGKYTFRSNASANDMWLDVCFEDHEFEEAVLAYILRLLAMRYKCFKGMRVKTCCQAQ